MKRLVSLLLAVAMLLCLAACKKDAPTDEEVPDALPAETEYVQDYVPEETFYEPEESVPPPITEEESSQEIVEDVAMNLTLILNIHELPEVVPNNEDSIVAIRQWMVDMNERDLTFKFDAANLEMSEYGYRLNLEWPCDYYGSPICIWVQQAPSGLQVVVVAAGPDGKYTYEGYGKDYTSIGFGDDTVKKIELPW